MKSMREEQRQKVCLTIAGIDPSGGAGVYADIKTFAAYGCYAAAVITSITFQNTQGVYGAEHQTADSVRRQAEPILDDMSVDALKTGMLPTLEVIETTAAIIGERDLNNLVVDPVVRSTSGYDLIGDDALGALIERLFPLADIVTPNLPETERIAGMKVRTEADIERAAGLIQEMGARTVLIKGGHLGPESGGRSERTARDYLFTNEGVRVFEAEYIDTASTHGTGCTLAAATAAGLALGRSLPDAVGSAKRYVHRAILESPGLGRGNPPVNHLIAPE